MSTISGSYALSVGGVASADLREAMLEKDAVVLGELDWKEVLRETRRASPADVKAGAVRWRFRERVRLMLRLRKAIG